MKEKIKKQNKHSLHTFFSRSLRHLSSVCWAGSNTKSLICQSPTSAGTGATAGHWEHWSTAVHRVCVCVCVCFKAVEVVFSINVMLYVLFKKILDVHERKWNSLLLYLPSCCVCVSVSCCCWRCWFCVTFAGLCPDWETWDPVKPVENATEAMQLADEWLGIPQVRFPPSDAASFFHFHFRNWPRQIWRNHVKQSKC